MAVAASLWNLPLVRTPKLDSFELLAWARRLASGDWTWPAVAQHGPGYPIFLAALLTIGGGSLKTVLVMQALLGACTAVLVASSARNLFGARAGLLAGLAYGVYSPAVLIDTSILSEGLLLFLLAMALWALTRSPASTGTALLAGAAFGAATLVRPTALVIAVACIAWTLFARRRKFALAAALAAIAVMVPAAARSWSTSQSISIQGYGGLNAYIGNSPQHDGRATFRLGGGWDALNSEAARSGIRDAAAEDRYYLAKARDEIVAQPIAFLRLLVRKSLWLLQSEEPRDSHSFYFFASQSAPLRFLPRWWLLFPLAAAGIAMRRRLGIVTPYLIGAAASVVLLVVGFRYRMPLVLGLAVCAGAGADAIATAFREHKQRELTIAMVVVLLTLAVSELLRDPRNTNLAEEWAFNGSALVTEHRLDEADAAYRRALELDPQSGLAWDGFGLTHLNSGRLADARSAFDRAIAIDRDSSRAIYHRALVDEREGKLAQAADGYERALGLSPFDGEVTERLAATRQQLATEFGMSGRTREARDAMRRVVELTPANGDAWLDLCLLSLDLHDRQTAATSLQRARELGADPRKTAFAAEALAKNSR